MRSSNHSKERIFLIGLPGAGKTTLGQALATTRGWPFIDLDQAIELAVGRPIAAIFQQNGEAAFRQIEADILRVVGLDTPLVLATGGGTPCFHDSMAWLLAHGQVLWLDVAPADIARRLLASPPSTLANRPLLATSVALPEATLAEALFSLSAYLTRTLDARRAFYALAPYKIAESSLQAAQKVLGWAS